MVKVLLKLVIIISIFVGVYFGLMQISVWKVGDWGECQDGSKVRKIHCSGPLECTSKKPKSIEECKGRWKEKLTSTCKDGKKERVYTCPKGYICPEKEGYQTGEFSKFEDSDCKGEWSEELSECGSNGLQKRTFTCPEGLSCPKKHSYTSGKFSVQEDCKADWILGGWTTCKNGERTRMISCPDKKRCYKRPSTKEKCYSKYTVSDWSECKDGKQQKKWSCPGGHLCLRHGTGHKDGYDTSFTIEQPCYSPTMKINDTCPSEGCIPKGKIKHKKQCLERTSYGVDLTYNCKDTEKQDFKYVPKTKQFKSHDDKCLLVNPHEILTIGECNTKSFGQRFLQTNDGKSSVLKDGKYIQTMRGGKYLHKEFGNSNIGTSDNMSSEFTYTDKGIWDYGKWGDCKSGNIQREVKCIGGDCPDINGNTNTFTDTKKCDEEGIIKNVKNYYNNCMSVKNGNLIIDRCHKVTNKKFKYKPQTSQLVASDGQCIEINPNSNNTLFLNSCDSNKTTQKFGYNEYKYLYSKNNKKYLTNWSNMLSRADFNYSKNNIDSFFRLAEK